MKVSFIIPAYNAEKTIGALLDSIRAQVTTHSFEVIVVNDGSLDKTAIIAAASGSRLLSVKNGGASRARNLGVREATGEILVFLDADVVLPVDWLEGALPSFFSPLIDVVQPSVVPDGVESFMTRFRRNFVSRKTLGTFNYLEVKDVSLPQLNSAALMIRANTFRRLGLEFPEDFLRVEDSYLAYNLFFSGAHFAVSEGSSVSVFDSRSALAYLRRSWNIGRWTQRLRAHWFYPEVTSSTGISKPTGDLSSVFMSLNDIAALMGETCERVTQNTLPRKKFTGVQKALRSDLRNRFFPEFSFAGSVRLVFRKEGLSVLRADDLSALHLSKNESETVRKSLLREPVEEEEVRALREKLSQAGFLEAPQAGK